MSQKIPFIYREFYDVPRMLVVRHRGLVLLLESRFDTQADDYSDRYDVFVLSGISEDELRGSWEDLASKATRFLGRVLVRDVEFDPTFRNELDSGLIDGLLAQNLQQPLQA